MRTLLLAMLIAAGTVAMPIRPAAARTHQHQATSMQHWQMHGTTHGMGNPQAARNRRGSPRR